MDMHEVTVPFHTELKMGSDILLSSKFAEFNMHLDSITAQPPASTLTAPTRARDGGASGGANNSKLKSALKKQQKQRQQRVAVCVVPLDAQGKVKKDDGEYVLASFSQDKDSVENIVQQVSVRFPVLRDYCSGFVLRLKLMDEVNNDAKRRQREEANEDQEDDAMSSSMSVILSGVQQTMLTAAQVAALKKQQQ